MTQTLPLSGLTVIDLSRVLAGPYCALMLSDLGARVIKVEQPGKGDDTRRYGPFSASGKSGYFTSINHAKESIALDLKNPDDRAVLDGLLSLADVLVENFRPGVMEKLGLGWEMLHARFPRLIYCAVSGFGHSGPDSQKAAYDVVAQGLSGMMSITGHPGGPPTRVGTSIGDISAGMFACSGVLAALLHRHKTSEGQLVDVAMLDGQLAILESAITRYEVTGQAPQPLGTHHPGITPFGAFACKDGHIIIAVGNDELWATLAQALAQPQWIEDPKLATNPARNADIFGLAKTLESVLMHSSRDHWLRVLTQAGVPCAPINTVAEAVAMPQVAARNMMVTTAYEDGTPLRVAGTPIKFSASLDAPTRVRAARLDEHGPPIRQALRSQNGALDRDFLHAAHRLADDAARIVRRYFRQPCAVDLKSDMSPVTLADRAVEESLRVTIEKDFPGHGIIGEEFGAVRETADYVWVIDPIDGTRSFMSGKPTFGTLIALLHEGIPVLGLIDQCIVQDRWIGAAGHVTIHNGTPAKPRACAALSHATIASTGPNYFKASELAAYERVRTACATSLWGGDCYNYGLLASGHIDVVIESGLKLHDFAALVPVVNGAGGLMCDWHGAPLTAHSSGQVIALGDAALLPQVRALLAHEAD
jgi:CoA:oxalate CoA-transferase